MCGIIGVTTQQGDVVREIYDGLLMLQHRGQDAAGMVTFDSKHFFEHKGNGLVKDVFHQKEIAFLKGNVGLGHVRYPTAGSNSAKEAQPFFVNAPFGIYLVHNGNITNTDFLRKKIQEKYRRHLLTTSDSEVLLNVFADKIYQEMKKVPDLQEKCKKNKNSEDLECYKIIFRAIKSTMNDVRGSYSVVTVIDDIGLVAFRDRAGIRPLVLGKRTTTRGDEWIVASEDIAMKALGFEPIRDIAPGEAILITPDGQMISKLCVPGELHPCIFEYVYLARPDSMLDKISVYKTQIRMGEKLAVKIKAANLKIDSIMPVPDSARPAALEIAQILGIKYREGLVKNRYVGRTFIMPGQAMRQKAIQRKLNTIDLEFKNKNILLVDDSIVRGNTMKKIVEMCRAAGANKVYVASAAPPIKNICVYGVDMPTKKELIANGLSIPEIQKLLRIDALFYQTVEDLIDSVKHKHSAVDKFCTGCFGGDYVTEEVTEEYIANVELSGRGARETQIEELPLINI
jgi:amidophosphoribosyltransferase